MSSKAIKSKVFYFTAPKRFEIRREPCPPPKAGEIRCKTICSLVSIGTESICYVRDVEKGSNWDNWIQYPFPPGYLSVGEVVDVGPGVKDFKRGDRAFYGMEHRSHFVAPAAEAVKLPDNVTNEEAAWLGLNTIVQMGIREVSPVLGATSVVIGLGPLGQIAIRLLGLTGQTNLVAVDPFKHRCDLAKGNGPTHILQMTADKAEPIIKELTGGRGADNVFDITGHPSVFHSAHRMLCRRGKLGLIGDVPRPALQTLTQDVIFKSIAIISSHGVTPLAVGNHFYPWGKKEMSKFFLDMIGAKRISMKGMITHRLKPEQAGDLYNDLLVNRGKYMGVIFDWR